MVLLRDRIRDVVNAVAMGRAYKDHLAKFLLLQLPSSLTAITLVFSEAFIYGSIIATVCFIFLTNLLYYPIAIVCMTRENQKKRFNDMVDRWRANKYPGTRTITQYMRAEYLKASIFFVTIYQIGALGGLYYYCDYLFTLVD